MASNRAMDTPTGGHDYDLVSDPPDRVVCKICHLPSRDPYLSVCCGHVFCKSCLCNAERVSTICPVCRDEEFVTFPNKAVDREVKGLHIYCSNKGRGCKWQGELNNISNHLGNGDGCDFKEVKCPNECGKMMQQQYLTNHTETECPCREVNCQYCHDTGEYQFIEGQHKEECPKVPLPCPNKCEVGSILREDMEAHRMECPLEMVECEYYSVGCKRVKLSRKDLEEHDNENMKEHLMMTKNELTNTKAQLNTALEQINSLSVLVNTELYRFHLNTMITSSQCICPVTFKMIGYQDRKENEKAWDSKPFYTGSGGYRMHLSVYPAGKGASEGTHMAVYLFLMKGSYDDKLTWPLRGTFDINC